MYVFVRQPSESAGVGRACELDREGDIAGAWPGAEHFKLQAHDAVAADRFGSAVSYLVRLTPTTTLYLSPFSPPLYRTSYPNPKQIPRQSTRPTLENDLQALCNIPGIETDHADNQTRAFIAADLFGLAPAHLASLNQPCPFSCSAETLS